MQTVQHREPIIEIIRNDLRVTQLLEGLRRTGIDPGDYSTSLGGVVFALMGLSTGPDHPEKLYRDYLQRLRAVRHLHPRRSYHKLPTMAEDIYRWLLEQ